MKKSKIAIAAAFFASGIAWAQTAGGVGFHTETPDPYADATLGSADKALLLNRVAGAEAVFGGDAKDGMVVYDTTKKCFRGYAKGAWVELSTCCTTCRAAAEEAAAPANNGQQVAQTTPDSDNKKKF